MAPPVDIICCQGCYVETEALFKCPNCEYFGKSDSFFCSQLCFNKNWKVHRELHGKLRQGSLISTQPGQSKTGRSDPTYDGWKGQNSEAENHCAKRECSTKESVITGIPVATKDEENSENGVSFLGEARSSEIWGRDVKPKKKSLLSGIDQVQVRQSSRRDINQLMVKYSRGNSSSKRSSAWSFFGPDRRTTWFRQLEKRVTGRYLNAMSISRFSIRQMKLHQRSWCWKISFFTLLVTFLGLSCMIYFFTAFGGQYFDNNHEYYVSEIAFPNTRRIIAIERKKGNWKKHFSDEASVDIQDDKFLYPFSHAGNQNPEPSHYQEADDEPGHLLAKGITRHPDSSRTKEDLRQETPNLFLIEKPILESRKNEATRSIGEFIRKTTVPGFEEPKLQPSTTQPNSSPGVDMQRFAGIPMTTEVPGSTPAVGLSSSTEVSGSTPGVGVVSSTEVPGSTPGVGVVSSTEVPGSTPGVGMVSSTEVPGSTPAVGLSSSTEVPGSTQGVDVASPMLFKKKPAPVKREHMESVKLSSADAFVSESESSVNRNDRYKAAPSWKNSEDSQSSITGSKINKREVGVIKREGKKDEAALFSSLEF